MHPTVPEPYIAHRAPLPCALVIALGCGVLFLSSGALHVGYANSALQDEGFRQYESLCAHCHGTDGHGGELGPAMVERLTLRSDAQLAALIRDGLPGAGMPGTAVAGDDLRDLVAFLRTLRPRRGTAPAQVTVETTDGRTLSGRRLNHSATDLQLLSDSEDDDEDGEPRIHLLRAAGGRYRPVTSQADWPTYNGDIRGNRYSALDQIDSSTVSRLAPRWVFMLPGTARLQVTPVVVDGIMYVTSGNECYALDAGSGRQLWHYRRPRSEGLVGDSSAGINRGVAVAGRRVFMVTDHAHLIALDRFTGALLWDTEMADWRQNYGATSAPLIVGDLVISGISGGDEGVRGFLSAFDRSTGAEVWRFWTVPRRGEPGSDTWIGTDIDHPCAATWLTGTYDPDLDILYWPTGNPCPDYDGAERQGDNLYSDSILALNPTTGELQWYFQYTPHDLWDWDAQQPPVLIDREWDGRPRQLLLHANRNGFFYVLDRTDGTLLLAEPFVQKLTWASGIGSDGRPILNPDQQPSAQGTKVCPTVAGATNLVLHVVPPGHRAVLRADIRALRDLHTDAGAVGVWPVLLRRVHAEPTRRVGGEGPARHRHPHRKQRLGAAAGWPRQFLGRDPGHGRRPRVLRRGQWCTHGGGGSDWHAALALSDQRGLESLAHDLHVRPPPARRGGGGIEHSVVYPG